MRYLICLSLCFIFFGCERCSRKNLEESNTSSTIEDPLNLEPPMPEEYLDDEFEETPPLDLFPEDENPDLQLIPSDEDADYNPL